MNIINDIELTEYFSLYEFECPCCKRVMLSPDLFTRLNHLRMVINRPIYINSGYRCKEENHRVGGVSGSYHLLGMAVDIHVKDFLLYDLLLYAQEIQCLILRYESLPYVSVNFSEVLRRKNILY